MDDEIKLSVFREGDRFVIRDQFGRKLSKVTDIEVETSYEDHTRVHVSFLDSSVKDGKAHGNTGSVD